MTVNLRKSITITYTIPYLKDEGKTTILLNCHFVCIYLYLSISPSIS